MIRHVTMDADKVVVDRNWTGIMRWVPLIFVVLAFLLWGERPLGDTSEALYGQAAFEMLKSGNWLIPTLGGQTHLTKPPLLYWLIGLGLKIFGGNARVACFFLSAAFLATIFAVRELTRTMGHDRRQAFAAAMIFATGSRQTEAKKIPPRPRLGKIIQNNPSPNR